MTTEIIKRALVIGIDDYRSAPLRGCVNDAVAMSRLLGAHGNGSPNFDVIQLTSDEAEVTSAAMEQAIAYLFKGAAETVLLYFAGHGIISPELDTGYLVSQDGKPGGWGVSLSAILGLANKAYPLIKSTVIILDSCHSGFAGEPAGMSLGGASVIGPGLTILTATQRDGQAEDGEQHGVFTEMLLDGMRGGCADIRGFITPAALYSHVDQTLRSWGQRPVYKANVHSFITIRRVAPKVPSETLRRLPEYFPSRVSVYPLDPSYEADRRNIPELSHIPVVASHVAIMKELQRCNRYGLVEPVDEEHMYYAAINSTGCRLTPLGAHYRKLAELKRL